MALLYGVETNCTQAEIDIALDRAALFLQEMPSEIGGAEYMTEVSAAGSGDSVKGFMYHHGFQANPQAVIQWLNASA